MCLEAHFDKPRLRQSELRHSAVKVDLNCSKELDETPQPIPTVAGEMLINIDDVELNLSPSSKRELSSENIMRGSNQIMNGPGQ